ncbi:MAG: MmgE/PrpD family protein [Pseudomonadota bacterium]
MSTVTQHLAGLLSRPVSDADRARAAVLLLDWTGCAVAGRAEPAGRKVAAAFPDETGRCTRIGASPASPQMAALHNGCLGNVLEMDDVDRRAVLHAAPTVIPAALAMAQHVGATKDALLDAIVVGYEATIRVGRAVGPGHYAFWHNTATCGPFGAAAAACHLLEGSDLVSALGLAGTQAAGLWQTRHEPDSMAKQLHAGHAAQVGVQSALLSAQGFQGPRMILEGEQGFFAALCPGADALDVLFEAKGWLLHETSLKPYPACRHAHPAIDAALKATDTGGGIVVRTYADALKFCDRPDPQSVIKAKFSLQHSVAVALKKGEPTLADFEAEAIARHAATRARVQVERGASFDAAYPAHYGASVEIGGALWTAADALGDPEVPMSDAQVRGKANELMRHGGMGESGALIEAALGGTLADYFKALP